MHFGLPRRHCTLRGGDQYDFVPVRKEGIDAGGIEFARLVVFEVRTRDRKRHRILVGSQDLGLRPTTASWSIRRFVKIRSAPAQTRGARRRRAAVLRGGKKSSAKKFEEIYPALEDDRPAIHDCIYDAAGAAVNRHPLHDAIGTKIRR